MSQNHLTKTQFSSLKIESEIIDALKTTDFQFCTPVQALTLPVALRNESVIGQARTGSGKTLAFLIATINRLLTNKERGETHEDINPVRALILAPTRELAVQIEKDAALLLKNSKLTLGLAYGGADYEKQRNQIQKGVDILIGTPGRLIDYFKQRVFTLKYIEVLVLDEADRMLDLGFIKDIRFLLRRMPPPEQRLNLLFSATLSHRVLELAYEHLGAPTVINAEDEEISTENIQQWVYYPGNEEKIPLLLGLFQKFKPERAIIFVNTKVDADLIYRYLIGNDINAGVLSGDVPQKKRQRLVLEFEKGSLPILVATDVAARGLHIPEVSHIFNYDLPQDAEDYVHRIGRTGRIGAKGIAISFVCESFAFSLPDIEAYIGKKLPSEAVNPDILIKPKPPVKITKVEGKRHSRPRDAKAGAKRRSSESGGRPRKKTSHGGRGHQHKKTQASG